MSGADPIILGNVSFGPAQTLPPEVANEVMNQMAESIVDLAHKLEESEARVAVLEEEQKILKRERDIAINGETIEEWDHWRTTGERDELAEALREARATIESLRDQLCADKCRDKAAADGGWANI
jgi:SMC interacting uncharacterized protein involved in chromosome segregation